MDRILEELKKMESLSSTYSTLKKNIVELMDNKKKTLKLKENVKNMKILSNDRRIKKNLYLKRESLESELGHSLMHYCTELSKNFKQQKQKVENEIDKECEKIKGQYIKDMKTKNAKEIEALNKENAAYKKILDNLKKDIDNILNEINSGNVANAGKLKDKQSEYNANKTKINDIDKKIKVMKNVTIDEKSIDGYTRLLKLKDKVSKMKVSDLEKFSAKNFLNEDDKNNKKDEEPRTMADLYDENGNYIGTAPKGKEDNNKGNDGNKGKGKDDNKNNDKEKDEEPRTMADLYDENGNYIGTAPKGKEDNNKGNDGNKSKGKDDDKNNDKEKNEEPRTVNELYDTKGNYIGTAPKVKFVMNVPEKKLNVNDININRLSKKDEKELKNDSFLAIKSYFYKDKNIKNIDFTLLSTLNKLDKNLAMDYLNVIRGGGISGYGTAVESLDRLQNAVQFKYQFKRGIGTLFKTKDKRIARAANRLGLAEIEGISEKGFLDIIKDKFPKSKRFKANEKIKAIPSGEAKTIAQLDKEKTIEGIKEDRANGSRVVPKEKDITFKKDMQVDETTKKNIRNVSRKYSEVEKDTTSKIGEDVKNIVAEANAQGKQEPEVGEK